MAKDRVWVMTSVGPMEQDEGTTVFKTKEKAFSVGGDWAASLAKEELEGIDWEEGDEDHDASQATLKAVIAAHEKGDDEKAVELWVEYYYECGYDGSQPSFTIEESSLS